MKNWTFKGAFMKKYFFWILFFSSCCIASTTSVRIYHQSLAALSSLQGKQIGVNSSADADLGYRMWGGKDAAGAVTQWLAKDKNARVLSMRQDSSFSKKDTSMLYKGDSAFITGLKATRFNVTTLTSDSINATGGTNLNRVTMDSVLSINKLIQVTGDSAYLAALKNDRFYFGVQNGTTLVADSARVLKMRIGGATGTVIDTVTMSDGAEDTLRIMVGAKTWKFVPVANQ